MTRKKRIKALSKLCHTGQIFVAEVLESDPDFITLSKRHVTEHDEKSIQEFFSLGKRFHNVMKNIAIKRQIPLADICEEIGWPLYKKLDAVETIETKLEQHPFNILLQKDLICGYGFSEKSTDYLMENHLDLFGLQKYHKSFIAHLISYNMNGVDDIKKNFQKCYDEQVNYSDTQLEIVMNECPKYQFQFTGTNKEQLLEYMDKCKKILECFKTLGFYNCE